jgi:hypothetical protein
MRGDGIIRVHGRHSTPGVDTCSCRHDIPRVCLRRNLNPYESVPAKAGRVLAEGQRERFMPAQACVGRTLRAPRGSISYTQSRSEYLAQEHSLGTMVVLEGYLSN